MSDILNFLVESNIALMICWLFYRTTLRHDYHFQAGRIFLLFSVVFSFAIPFVSIDIPSAPSIPTLPTLRLPEVIIAGNIQAANTGITWSQWLLIFYGLVAGILTVLVIIRSFRLFRMVHHVGHGRSNHGQFILVQTFNGMGTFSFFHYLFLDMSVHLSEEERDQVILHESVHIRQWHSFDRLLLEFICAVFWFNPTAWWVRKELANLHEYIADQKVVNHFCPDGYKDLLVKTSYHSMGMAMANNFNQSQILNRLKIMEKQHAKSKIWKWLLGIPVIALVCLISCQDELEESKSERQLDSEVLEQQIELLRQELKMHQEKLKEVELQNYQDQASKFRIGEEIFTVTEELAQPNGGMKNFYKFMASSLKYPTEAQKKGIEGKVYVQFVVTKSGTITQVEVVKGLDPQLDRAALEVIKKSPLWIPAKQRGIAVNQKVVLPITFALN